MEIIFNVFVKSSFDILKYDIVYLVTIIFICLNYNNIRFYIKEFENRAKVFAIIIQIIGWLLFIIISLILIILNILYLYNFIFGIIMYIIIIIIILTYLINNPKKTNLEVTDRIEQDSCKNLPILINDDDDITGFLKYTIDLVKKLIINQNIYSIGITGGFGSGKTTVVENLKNLFKKEYIRNKNIDYIFININVWQHNSVEGIISGIADTIAYNINDYYIKTLFRKWEKEMNINVNTGLINVNFNFGKLSIDEFREKLHKRLKDLNKHLIFVIDDIDRIIDKNKITNVLKLYQWFLPPIKIEKSNINLLYLLNPNEVMKIIKDSESDNSNNNYCNEDFLKKFINHMVSVPKSDIVFVKKLINKKLKLMKEIVTYKEKEEKKGEEVFKVFPFYNLSLREINMLICYLNVLFSNQIAYLPYELILHYYFDIKYPEFSFILKELCEKLIITANSRLHENEMRIISTKVYKLLSRLSDSEKDVISNILPVIYLFKQEQIKNLISEKEFLDEMEKIYIPSLLFYEFSFKNPFVYSSFLNYDFNIKDSNNNEDLKKIIDKIKLKKYDEISEKEIEMLFNPEFIYPLIRHISINNDICEVKSSLLNYLVCIQFNSSYIEEGIGYQEMLRILFVMYGYDEVYSFYTKEINYNELNYIALVYIYYYFGRENYIIYTHGDPPDNKIADKTIELWKLMVNNISKIDETNINNFMSKFSVFPSNEEKELPYWLHYFYLKKQRNQSNDLKKEYNDFKERFIVYKKYQPILALNNYTGNNKRRTIFIYPYETDENGKEIANIANEEKVINILSKSGYEYANIEEKEDERYFLSSSKDKQNDNEKKKDLLAIFGLILGEIMMKINIKNKIITVVYYNDENITNMLNEGSGYFENQSKIILDKWSYSGKEGVYILNYNKLIQFTESSKNENIKEYIEYSSENGWKESLQINTSITYKDSESRRRTTYSTGEKPGKGTYKCTKCGQKVVLDDTTDTLPPCPKCHNTKFRKN